MANLQGIIKSIRDIMWQDTGLNGDAQRIEQLGWMLFFKIFSDKDQELELLDDNYKSPIPEELHWQNWAGNDEGMTITGPGFAQSSTCSSPLSPYPQLQLPLRAKKSTGDET